MEIQKAQEFIIKIRHMVPMLGPRGGNIGWKVEISNEDAADLIRARDKAIIERCKEEINKWEPPTNCDVGEHMHRQWKLDMEHLDSILGELEGGA